MKLYTSNRIFWAGVFLLGCGIIADVVYSQDKPKSQIVEVRIDGSSAGFGFVFDGKTYVPLRSITEKFGCDVRYDEIKQVVHISQPAASVSTGGILPSTIRFSGSTSRKTEPFRMESRRWKITWKHTPSDDSSYFSITLHRVSDERIVDMVANISKAGGETSHQYSPGEFYFHITASADYEIVVERE